MALIIDENCIACDACVAPCPVEAIKEGDPIYIIDKTKCCECIGFFQEPACVNSCPVDAILLDASYIESKKELAHKAKEYKKSK